METLNDAATRVARGARQREINHHVTRLFGARFLTLRNRVERLVEEVAELAQAEDFPLEDALRVVRLAYEGKKGDPDQEIGGISVCVLSYCEVKGRSADALERRELDRLASKTPEELADKLQAKLASGIVTDEEPVEEVTWDRSERPDGLPSIDPRDIAA